MQFDEAWKLKAETGRREKRLALEHPIYKGLRSHCEVFKKIVPVNGKLHNNIFTKGDRGISFKQDYWVTDTNS